MVKVAVLGYGTVGSGVVGVLDENAAEVAKSAGDAVEVKYILDLREFPGDKHEAQVVHDINIILDDPEIQVICETMGGLEPAFTFEKNALMKGKSVCTSNKELVAAHGPELVALAKKNNCSYMFEASVGGGIPILHTLNTTICHEKIDRITGILNGTTNYILTKMDREGAQFEDVLKIAQGKGYAERNPEADIEGYDACRKTAILASLVSGEYVDYNDIYTEGITKITKEDFDYASGLGYVIKLLGMIKKDETGFFTMVAPFMIDSDNPLSGVNGVFNAISVHGNMLGTSMYYGRGAGRDATASAVVGDMIDCVKHQGEHINVNLNETPAKLSSNENYTHGFFVRVTAEAETMAAKVFEGLIGDQIHAESATDEYAFTTTPVSEKKFTELFEKLEGPKSYIRIL